MLGAYYAPILRQDLHNLQTGRNELLVEPRNLGVPSGVSKMISELMVRLVHTMTPSCTDINSISKRTETRFHRTHIAEEFHQLRPKEFLRLWCSHCNPCTYLASRLDYLRTDRNELPVEPCHLGGPSGASEMISEAMVLLPQTMHLSCTDTNNVSKRTETRFHMTHVT
jgi:hypothetical protein